MMIRYVIIYFHWFSIDIIFFRTPFIIDGLFIFIFHYFHKIFSSLLLRHILILPLAIAIATPLLRRHINIAILLLLLRHWYYYTYMPFYCHYYYIITILLR